jgi:nucleotide-binding universal stress UspA family protein
MSGILIGVDGSKHSCRALDWALREAVWRDLPVTVLAVRTVPDRPATEACWSTRVLPDSAQDLETLRADMREFAEKAACEIGSPVPGINVIVTTGDPAEELLRAACDASMIVIGSRGAGGFARLLLGSVTIKVAHHATCPVVIVPEPR